MSADIACLKRNLRKICAVQNPIGLAQRYEQDRNFAYLLDRAQDVSGLPVDLSEAQPRQQRDNNDDQNQSRNCKHGAESERDNQNSQYGGGDNAFARRLAGRC